MATAKRVYRVSTRIDLDTENRIVELVKGGKFDRSDIVRLALEQGLPLVKELLRFTKK